MIGATSCGVQNVWFTPISISPVIGRNARPAAPNTVLISRRRLMSYTIQYSNKITKRNLVIAQWGDRGTRKTENVLRNFPKVLLIDTEGNATMCVDMPEIPPFILIQTKDCREIDQILGDVMAGKIKFEDGSLPVTVCIDTVTILWAVQSEVASMLAEKRANKDAAIITPVDWTRAKRPLKKIYNKLNNCPIKYVVLNAREKDLTKDDGYGNPQKIGFTLDAMKGLGYEVNLELRCQTDEGGKWSYKVSKVQGSLGKIFPMNSSKNVFDFDALFNYAENIIPSTGTQKDDQQIAAKIVSEEEDEKPKVMADLVTYAQSVGLEPNMVGQILKGAGYTGFKPELYDKFVVALQNYVQENSIQVG
jgi:hypothetical protein